MILYDYARAPSPRRARILLAEKGIPHDTVSIDLATAEQMTPSYRAINPHCTVPTLALDDGSFLTDNAAIIAYAEAAFPDPPLLGITPHEKAEIASWNARVEMEGFMAIAEALRNSSPGMVDRALPGPVNYAQIPELAARGLQRLNQFFETLNTRLAGRAYIATDRFSLVDITAVVAVDFARILRVSPDDRHPHIQAWRARMAERPSMSL